jgi:hypothetical protein
MFRMIGLHRPLQMTRCLISAEFKFENHILLSGACVSLTWNSIESVSFANSFAFCE